MSYRLIYSPVALRHLERAPAQLRECIEYHLGEMERADSAPGTPIDYPHLPGMGYYFRCADRENATTYQLVARYKFAEDESSLILLGIGCYPLESPSDE